MSIYAQDLQYTPYFYIIQNLNSGMFYAGCRFSKEKTKFSYNGCHPIELMKIDGYLTSSNLIKTLIKKDGIDSFSVIQILTEEEIKESVLVYETKFLQENDISHNDLWYNMHNNDSRWFDQEYVKKVMLERYGVENAFAAEEIKEKIYNTNLSKYGFKSPCQNGSIKQKVKDTNLVRYGAECSLHSEMIKQKVKDTNLERYGVENAGSSADIIEKIYDTNLKKYGVKHPLQNKTILEKAKTTCVERYGYSNPAMAEEVQDKMKATNLSKYGVDNYSKTEKAKLTTSKRSKGAKFYNDGIRNYFVPPNEEPNKNWVPGMVKRNKTI